MYTKQVMLIQETVEKYFDDASFSRTLKAISRNLYIQTTYTEIREAAISLVKTPNGLLLDAGCGVGLLSAIFNDCLRNPKLATWVNYKIIGVDISHQSLCLANKQNFNNSEYCRADLSNLPFRDNTFDVVFLIEVIEHIPDKYRVFRELRRVTKNNGQIIVTTPNSNCMTLKFHNKLLNLGLRMFKRKIFDKDEYCNMNELIEIALKCGLYVSNNFYLHINPVALTWKGKTYGILPVATPRQLLYWLKKIRKFEQKIHIPLWLKKYICWTIILDIRK